MSLSYRLVRLASRLLALLLTRCRTVTGIEHIPKSGAAILAGNHISYWDPATLVAWVPRPVRFLSKSEMFEVPVLGWIFRHLQVIGLERNSPDLAAIRETMQVLKQGELVALYPQGSRVPLPGGRRHPAKGGVLLLAERSGAVIVPVALKGMDRLFKGRPEVRIAFGPPIAFDDLVQEAAGSRDRSLLLPLLMKRIDNLLAP